MEEKEKGKKYYDVCSYWNFVFRIGDLFYDKHFDRLKVICYYIAIVFLVLAAIEVMVGDLRLVFGH